ncbi:Ppx/GppA phosphatase family protein [Marinomonas sp. 15G1-11]|uniref:Ppx/GppA phosphatase family protein n=1 Tax=Marinomonas phaeophyticola TaxID=3004091 RepID=A0ABT4JRL4_9GAMM|nr:Ppx/GppA phosphatase family protein [Marinomonas sp. 15G1-11]MCZ2720997.1 Ppx/GppA phosphatase family protein [Marinomonas sp. 15G1-11]
MQSLFQQQTHDLPFEKIAAIDLGSNSFHMVIAQINHGQLRITNEYGEKVQLAAGLVNDVLDDDALQRGLDCLSRFAQVIEDMPLGSVRIVGTNALRVADNRYDFIGKAMDIISHPVEIIAGREEARLIYVGVSNTMDHGDQKRLVVDIGGGSTEFIIGQHLKPIMTESLHMGCVSFRQRFFADGVINKTNFQKAVTSARLELFSIQDDYLEEKWDIAIGSSGTIKAAYNIIKENAWSKKGITLKALKMIQKALFEAGHADNINLVGLKPERKSTFAAGIAILTAVFECFDIKQMDFSNGALREGVLYDIVGRYTETDIRETTVQYLLNQYHIDTQQSKLVMNTAISALAQVKEDWGLNSVSVEDLLRWGALIHEIGVGISHSRYHKHGAYIISESDLPGFSQQEQQALANLVLRHRRKFSQSLMYRFTKSDQLELDKLAILLRLAIVMHHDRKEGDMPIFTLQAKDKTLKLEFLPDWLASRPLTEATLQQEADYLAAEGYKLSFS